MKKLLLFLGIFFIVGIILVGGYYFYHLSSLVSPPPTTATSSDGSAQISATFYDSNGNPVQNGIAQSFINGNSPSAKFMSLIIQLKYVGGNADLKNVRLGTMTVPFSDNLALKQPIFTTLPTTQTSLITFIDSRKSKTGSTCASDSDCGTKENCLATNCLINLTKYESLNVATPSIANFSTTIRYDIIDGSGNTRTMESSIISLTYDIRAEKCSDNTKYLSCVYSRTSNDSDKPFYCTNTTATSSIQLISKASICQCPAGKQVSGETCVTQIINCPDGSSPSSFSTASINNVSVSGNIVNLTSGFAGLNFNKTRVYCNSSSNLEFACTKAKTDLCSGSICSGSCGTDFNGGTAIACSVSTPSMCQFRDYTGNLSACIPQCLGKNTGADDGCGGIC